MLCSGTRVKESEFFAGAKGLVQPFSRNVGNFRRPFFTAITVAISISWHGGARAQARVESRPQNQPPEQGLIVEPSISTTYDSNVYRVDSDNEDPTDDLIVTPQVQVTYSRDVGPRAFNLRALVGYDQFVSESQRSKPRLAFEGNAKFLLAGQCAFKPLASYRQERADYGDINSATENLQHFSTLAISADCERPAGIYPLAAYQRDTTRNADQFDYADQTSNRYRGGVGYARPSIGTFTAYLERVDSDRPQLGVRNHTRSYGLTFDRAVSPITQISADLRWMHVTSNSAAIGRYNGPGWNVRLSTTAIPRTKLTVQTQRDIVNDSLIATGFAVRTTHQIAADVKLSELTSLGAYAQFIRRDFRQDAAIRAFSYTHDRINQFGVRASRKLSERLDLNLDASHVDRKTNSTVSNYRAQQVTLGATMRF